MDISFQFVNGFFSISFYSFLFLSILFYFTISLTVYYRISSDIFLTHLGFPTLNRGYCLRHRVRRWVSELLWRTCTMCNSIRQLEASKCLFQTVSCICLEPELFPILHFCPQPNDAWKKLEKWVSEFIKVHIFWEGHKILRNLHCRFDRYYIGQI